MMKPQLTHVFFFLLLSLSCQSAFSSRLTADGNIVDVKKIVLAELKKVVGLPDLAAGGDNAAWTVKSVEFIMDKMNWKFDLTNHEADLKYIEGAVKLIVTAFSWLLDDPQLNPYSLFTKKLTTFRSLFKYISELDSLRVYGGLNNPIYKCFKDFWPTCLHPAPATFQGALVYRFDCGYHFYGVCQLKKWAEDGTWHVPIIDGAQ